LLASRALIKTRAMLALTSLQTEAKLVSSLLHTLRKVLAEYIQN
jgi:hypothetical protein